MSQEFFRGATSAVSWAVPPGKPDPIFGTGAIRAEKGLANIVGLVGAVGITALALGTNASWSWAQYILAVIISSDVVGGVVANGLNSAKRDHFGSHGQRPESFGMKLVRRPVLFTALHLHPIYLLPWCSLRHSGGGARSGISSPSRVPSPSDVQRCISSDRSPWRSAHSRASQHSSPRPLISGRGCLSCLP